MTPTPFAAIVLLADLGTGPLSMPEPAAWMLWLGGGLALAAARRRKG